MTRVLVFSAHLDDAVLSIGGYLAEQPGAIVVTAMAGAPTPARITTWDRRCGFASSDIAVAVRRREDRAALSRLDAKAVHLDFLDGQYGVTHSGELADAATEQIARFDPEVVLGPLGVLHPDHVLVRNAVLAADMDVPVWVYGDLPYCESAPDVADEVLSGLRTRGFALAPVDGFGGSRHAKAAALQHYSSQLRHPIFDAIEGMRERLWRVNRPADTGDETPPRGAHL